MLKNEEVNPLSPPPPPPPPPPLSFPPLPPLPLFPFSYWFFLSLPPPLRFFLLNIEKPEFNRH